MRTEAIIMAGMIGFTGIGSGAVIGYYADTRLEIEQLRNSLLRADINVAELELQVKEIRLALEYSR